MTLKDYQHVDDSNSYLPTTWQYISLSVCSAHLKMSVFFSFQVQQDRKYNLFFPPPSTVWPLSLFIMFKILSRCHRFSTWYRCVIIRWYDLKPNISYLAHTSNSAVFRISPPQTYIHTFCHCYRIKRRILLAYLGLFVTLLAGKLQFQNLKKISVWSQQIQRLTKNM